VPSTELAGSKPRSEFPAWLLDLNAPVSLSRNHITVGRSHGPCRYSLPNESRIRVIKNRKLRYATTAAILWHTPLYPKAFHPRGLRLLTYDALHASAFENQCYSRSRALDFMSSSSLIRTEQLFNFSLYGKGHKPLKTREDE